MMVRHLTIAATCLGVALLLGSGAVIGQLWTWSHSTEQQLVKLRGDLEEAKESLIQARGQSKQAASQARALQADMANVERIRDQLLADNSGLRTEILTKEAQNEELQKAADNAVTLSDRVAQLEMKLRLSERALAERRRLERAGPGVTDNQDRPATSPASQLASEDRSARLKSEAAPPDESQLVRVRRRPTTFTGRQQTFDDRGWKSVAPSSAGPVPRAVSRP